LTDVPIPKLFCFDDLPISTYDSGIIGALGTFFFFLLQQSFEVFIL
jgi:hypothetical protein